jgi:microcystin degradation protein MlrC
VRFATAYIGHECNAFLPLKADVEHIKSLSGTFVFGSDMLRKYEGTRECIGGIIDGSKNLGFELVLVGGVSAGAFGIIGKEACDFMLTKILDGIKDAGEVDGLLLYTHGAGRSEQYPDLEGHYFSELRKLVGRDLPIVSAFDWHANYTQEMLDKIDIAVGYDTYPHLDDYERGLEAANLIVKMVTGKIKPTKVLEKPPMLLTLQAQATDRYPISALMQMVHEFEKDARVVNITVAGGFPWSDCKNPTLSIIVTTNDDPDLAKDMAKKLRDFIWSRRTDLLIGAEITPLKEAVSEAINAKEGPVVLADVGDVPGCGAAGDGTMLLKALLELHAKNTVFAAIWDAEAVAKAIDVGVGNEVTMTVGGRVDKFQGSPLRVKGRVRHISDGKFVCKGPMDTGYVENLGRTVVLDCDGILLILTEARRNDPTDLEFYRSLGIEPTEKKILAVKGCVHCRASHRPIAKKMIEVDTPGLSSPRLGTLPFKSLKRPIFPLDLEMLGLVELKTMDEE